MKKEKEQVTKGKERSVKRRKVGRAGADRITREEGEDPGRKSILREIEKGGEKEEKKKNVVGRDPLNVPQRRRDLH